MLPSLPWVPKGCSFVYVLCMFCKYFKGTMVNHKLPWVCPYPSVTGLSSALYLPSCGRRTLLGSLQCWSVGGTEASVQVAFFILNPPEMTRQFSSTALGRSIKQAASSGSLCAYRVWWPKRELWVCITATSHLRFFQKWYLLTLSQQRRRQLMSFADSSLKAMWILVL